MPYEHCELSCLGVWGGKMFIIWQCKAGTVLLYAGHEHDAIYFSYLLTFTHMSDLLLISLLKNNFYVFFKPSPDQWKVMENFSCEISFDLAVGL